jgi:hypothetical protein
VTTRAPRLPGVRFETVPPPPADVLPRMDVAALVGFAASGPLDVPVPVEDAAAFADVFGADALLAWDDERGEFTRAHLAPAVRAFFRNGGKRCWAIRVAGAARANVFPVPGLVARAPDGTLRPAFASARSEGSWSDELRVAAALSTELLSFTTVNPVMPAVDLRADAPADVAAGDLLRAVYAEKGYALHFAVQRIERGDSERTARGMGGVWLQAAGGKQPADADVSLRVFGSRGPKTTFPARPFLGDDGNQWPTKPDDSAVAVDVACALTDAPSPGAVVWIDFVEGPFWLTVRTVREVPFPAAPTKARVRLTGTGMWQLPGVPADVPEKPTHVERLTFELRARSGTVVRRLDGLGFVRGHASFWGDLPTDAALFGTERPDPRLAGLWEVARGPRFPLAGGDTALSLPIGMLPFADSFLGAEPPDDLDETALHRDGLSEFGAGLFLGGRDPAVMRTLVGASAGRLLPEADAIRWGGPESHALGGVYAALGLEEVTVIAVPDAVHRGWSLVQNPVPDTPAIEEEKPPEPEPGFAVCPPKVDPVPEPPELSASVPNETGAFVVQWATVPGVGVRYALEETAEPAFDEPVEVFEGTALRIDLRRPPRMYRYRVRAEIGAVRTAWSAPVFVWVGSRRWVTEPVSATPVALFDVHRALLRMCAARADLFAVLALPEHFRETEAAAYARELGHVIGFGPGAAPSDEALTQPLNAGEVGALSYGAIYHPWMYGREENEPALIRRVPPDGAACGILAKRAIERGAWIAPANERLVGVVALVPEIDAEHRLDLQESRVNLIRQEPRGFLALCADTLSPDEDLRDIGVRRLLILLRRLALRVGTNYVFEPNSPAFRRAVKRGFDEVLGFLFARGAFAGRTPDESFRVVVGEDLNTPASVELGRFVVELRVAPSRPLQFLTVRLVQTGERGTVREGA